MSSLTPASILRSTPTKAECETSVKLTAQLSSSNQNVVSGLEDALRKQGGQFLLTESSSDFKILPFIFLFLRRKAFTARLELSLELKTKALVQLMRRKLAEKLGVRFHDIFLHPTEDDKDIQKETTLLATILHDNPVSEATRLEALCASDENKSEARLDLGQIEITYQLESWNQFQPVLRLMVSDFDETKSEAPPTNINGKLIEHSVVLNANDRFNDERLNSKSGWYEAMTGPRVEFDPTEEENLGEYDNKTAENPSENFFQFRLLDRVESIYEDDTLGKNDERIVILVRVDQRKAYFPKPGEKVVVVPTVHDARPYRILYLQKRKKIDFKDKTMSALAEVYERPKPTIEEQKASETLISVSNSDIQVVAHELTAALGDMGGEFILTNNDSESDLELLPYIFTAPRPARLNFNMTLDVDYDQVVRGEDENGEDGTFAQTLKEKVARAAELSIEDIVILRTYKGSTNVEFSIPEELDTDTLREKLQRAKISPLAHDVNLVLKLSVNDFDPAGDNDKFCHKTYIRGGLPYYQPSKIWRRIGLRVKGKYDDGLNAWLMKNGNPMEWAVGFHGCRTMDSTSAIAKERTFKTEHPVPIPTPDGGIRTSKQKLANDVDTNPEGINKGNLCGKGAYFANEIKYAENYAFEKTHINNERVSLVFQVRLNPKTVRIPSCKPYYFIAPDTESARPYGICIRNADVVDEHDGYIPVTTNIPTTTEKQRESKPLKKQRSSCFCW